MDVGDTVFLPIDQLSPSILRIVEVPGSPDLMELDGKRFTKAADLVGHLKAQPRDRFRDGVLLEFVNKQAGDENVAVEVSEFCVRRNLDLFAIAPMSKGDPGASWLVRSSKSSYSAPP